MDNSTKRIEKVLIVGGGTAGWIAACYLNKALNSNDKSCDITLIESHDIPSVGVGEATIPNISQLFRFLEIPENIWMSQCNATYKLAIKFEGWNDNALGDYYWHTFGSIAPNQGGNISLSQVWVHERNKGLDLPFAKATQEAVYLCEKNKSPKIPFKQSQKTPPYAYHLDAGLLANMLKEYATKNGVRHLVDQVDQVVLGDKGYIKEIKTKNEQYLEADLFIDCSGFKSLLLDKVLGEPWESYGDSLLVDSAVAIGSPYEEGDIYNEKLGGINSYTTAKTHNAGWSWHTPLITRDGNGYVYSSNFIDKEQAEAEFRKHLGARSDNSVARPLKFKVGKYKRSWVKNCVSIGLSSGFIEPLESTGIALIQIAVQNLIYNFPDKTFDPALIDNFNYKLHEQYENIRDFIILHYCLTQREDTPFWKAVKYDATIPDTLKERLEEWKTLWPNGKITANLMFGPYNYKSILAGMNYLPSRSLPILDFYKTGDTVFQNIKTKGESMAETHPTQAEYFKEILKVKAFQLDEDW